MQLTTKQIKQIIKEELDKVLRENLYLTNLNIMNQKHSREPEAWEEETDQYFKMLEEGLFEDFLGLVSDDLPMLAYMLRVGDYLDNHEAQQFLGSIANMEEYPDAARLVRDYIKKSSGSLAQKIRSNKEEAQ